MSTFRRIISRPKFALEHKKIVLYGDSLTQRGFELGGWAARLANRYARRADVLNRGLSGYNSRWGIRAARHAVPADTDVLVLWFGANDAVLRSVSPKQSVPIDEYKRNMEGLVKLGRDKGCRVIVLTPPPVCEDKRLAFQQKKHGLLFSENKRLHRVTEKYAIACREIAEEIDVPYIDIWTQMDELSGGWRHLLGDGVHLSPEGHQFAYESVVRAIYEFHPDFHVELPSEDSSKWHRVERSRSELTPWLPDSADIDEIARESWRLPH